LDNNRRQFSIRFQQRRDGEVLVVFKEPFHSLLCEVANSDVVALDLADHHLLARVFQFVGHEERRPTVASSVNRREGLRADWNRVFAEAARLGKAVEIDGYADRQDFRLSLLKIARQEGVRISLGTDAHHPDQLAFMELSLAAASLAKIPTERIVNFLPLTEFKAWVAEVRESAEAGHFKRAAKRTSELPPKSAFRRRPGSRRSL
jgi:hypothetical protein